MDWNLAIERNSVALKRIVAMLGEMAGLGTAPTSPSRGEVAARSGAGGGGTFAGIVTDGREHPTPDLRSDPPPRGEGDALRPTLPRRLHRAVLRLLRPAESAVRRLIVIAARGLVVQLPPPRPPREPKPASIFLRRGSRGTGIIMPPETVYFSVEKQRLFGSGASGKVNCPQRICLPLFDPLKRPYCRHRPTPICEPRISYAGPFATLSPVKLRQPPSADDRLDATRLALRLRALAATLDDLPAQANRLARWRARRDAGAQFLAPAGGGGEVSSPKGETERGRAPTSQSKPPRHRRLSPLRPGRPPGLSRRLDADMRDLLTDLHGLAHDAFNDTS